MYLGLHRVPETRVLEAHWRNGLPNASWTRLFFIFCQILCMLDNFSKTPNAKKNLKKIGIRILFFSNILGFFEIFQKKLQRTNDFSFCAKSCTKSLVLFYHIYSQLLCILKYGFPLKITQTRNDKMPRNKGQNSRKNILPFFC